MATNTAETKPVTTQTDGIEEPKKRSKVFPIILAALVIGAAWFGISKYTHGQHHE